LKPFLSAALAAALLANAPVHAEVTVNAGFEALAWEEFTAGSSLLTETGARAFVGLEAHSFNRQAAGVLYSVAFKGYAGDVDYDGSTWDGTPASTTTEYRGYTLEALGGYRFVPEGDYPNLDLYVGLGRDTWSRNLKSTAIALGYEERYTLVYGKLGVGLHAPLTAKTSGYLRLGGKYPLYTHERIAAFDVELEPGRQLSPFAELGAAYRLGADRRLNVTLSWDTYRLSESAAALANIGGTLVPVVQPESTLDLIGLKFGYSF